MISDPNSQNAILVRGLARVGYGMVTRSRLLRAAVDPSIVTMRKRAHVQYAITHSPYTIVTTSGFVALCRGATNVGEEQMAHTEAVAHLKALHDAKLVVYNAADDIVHLRPSQLLAHAHMDTPLNPAATMAATAESNAAIEEIFPITAATRAARWRRRFWSSIAVASGLQMATMSYLTFVQFDWDVMEPASYFLTSGTALGFFMYFVLLKREHTLTDVDRTAIANRFAITRKTTASITTAVPTFPPRAGMRNKHSGGAGDDIDGGDPEKEGHIHDVAPTPLTGDDKKIEDQMASSAPLSGVPKPDEPPRGGDEGSTPKR
jgi:hypothetical protein